MTTQYRCGNENRRDAVGKLTDSGGKPILNGIDYLEVISEDEKTLAVHFLHNLPGQTNGFPSTPILSEKNFVILGGVRITNITVKKVNVLDDIATLQVDGAGDYSNYVLRLITDEENSDPPSGFDPQLSAVAFTFKIDCPSDFDCKVEDICPPGNMPAPNIDYLAKDYSSFRQLMLDRLSTLMPNWAERNPADMQVALVEAIAYAGDQLSYYQDAVASEAYLGTARQRISVHRHARLLDYAMHDGCNARAWVYFEVGQGTAADKLLVKAGTPLLTPGLVGGTVVDPAEYDRLLREEKPNIFESLHDLTLHSEHNGISFYTWDDTDCCLPKGATRATLCNDPKLFLAPGDLLVFEEVISPATGLAADADPAHRHAVRLTEVVTQDSHGNPLLDPLHQTPIAEIAWDPQDTLPFPLCLSAEIDEGTGPHLVADLSLARGNILLADHGQTIDGEMIGTIGTDAEGHLAQPVLQSGPVTQQGHARNRFGRLVVDDENEQLVFDPNAPAASAFHWEMRDALPSASLFENGDQTRPWLPRHDLLASQRFDDNFVLEVDNDGLSHLRFGDGFHGAIPRPDSIFTARYRIGNGTDRKSVV